MRISRGRKLFRAFVILRTVSGQPCSLSEAADLSVLRPARHTKVCLRGRVLLNSSRLSSVRSAAAPKPSAHGQFWSCSSREAVNAVSLPLRRRLLPRRTSPIRGAILLRGIPLHCLACVSARPSRTVTAAFTQFDTPPRLPAHHLFSFHTDAGTCHHIVSRGLEISSDTQTND